MNNEQAASLLVVRWLPPETTALASISAAELTIDTSLAEIALVDEGLMGAQPLAASPMPSIVPAAEAGVYILINVPAGILHG